MEQFDKLYKNINTTNSDEYIKSIYAKISDIKCTDHYTPSQRLSYLVQSHYVTFDEASYQHAKSNKPFRKEEWICKLAMDKVFGEVGKIVDYQVPLKNSSLESEKGKGKIDLITRDGNTAYLLELKVKTSIEHPLRAIMEIYTYWQQLGGDHAIYFLDKSAAHGATKLKKAIVLFESSDKRNIYHKFIDNQEMLTQLMNELGVECFVARTTNDENKIDCIERL